MSLELNNEQQQVIEVFINKVKEFRIKLDTFTENDMQDYSKTIEL